MTRAPSVDLAAELDRQRAHLLAGGLELFRQLLDLPLELFVVRRRFRRDRLQLRFERLDLFVVESLSAALPLLDLPRQSQAEIGLLLRVTLDRPTVRFRQGLQVDIDAGERGFADQRAQPTTEVAHRFPDLAHLTLEHRGPALVAVLAGLFELVRQLLERLLERRKRSLELVVERLDLAVDLLFHRLELLSERFLDHRHRHFDLVVEVLHQAIDLFGDGFEVFVVFTRFVVHVLVVVLILLEILVVVVVLVSGRLREGDGK